MTRVAQIEEVGGTFTTVIDRSEVLETGTSLWGDAWRRLLKNKLAVAGLIYLIFVALVAIFAPLIAPFSYEETDLILGAIAPNRLHWLGTDDLGRDMFTRIVYGARVSLMVGVLGTTVSVIIGVIYGAVAGYAGGRADDLMMRMVDVLYALPFTILVIIIMVIFGRSI